jgi:hypothetical protein
MSPVPSLRARASAQEAVSDKLDALSNRLWDELCRARKAGDFEAARVLEIRFSAANRGCERACFRALGLRIAASRIEHHEQRARALMTVAA